MALSGTHVVCAFIGAPGAFSSVQSLLGTVAWSQTMASAGTTTQAAPPIGSNTGLPSFEVSSSVDIYIATGPTPDPVSGNRIWVPAFTTRNIFCNPGDKLAWTPA